MSSPDKAGQLLLFLNSLAPVSWFPVRDSGAVRLRGSVDFTKLFWSASHMLLFFKLILQNAQWSVNYKTLTSLRCEYQLNASCCIRKGAMQPALI